MKIKPATLFLVLAALLLSGVALIVQQQPTPTDSSSGEQVSESEQPLFTFQEADVQALTVQTQLRTLKFERDKNGKWQMQQPEKAAASDPSIAFLLDLVTTAKSPRTITAPVSDREQFGLHQPLATIDVTLKDQKTHKLVLGEYDFNRSHLYAQTDPPAEAADSLEVRLVSPNFENAVNRPVAEWKQATAKKSTASPSPSPKATDSNSEPLTSPANSDASQDTDQSEPNSSPNSDQ